jgi:hypothetical protein
MYHRFDSALLPKENIPNTLTHIIDHTISLNDHARLLEKVRKKTPNNTVYCIVLFFSVFESFAQYLKVK